MGELFKQFFNILIPILYIAILARVILSWLPIGGSNNPLVAFVYQITEPILAPLRWVVPRLGVFDLTPMIAIVLLGILQYLIDSL